MLGYGSSYLYQDGVLCYLRDNTIRVLHVHEAGSTEIVIDLIRLIITDLIDWSQTPHSRKETELRLAVEFLDYRHGILSILMADEITSGVITIDIRKEDEVTGSVPTRLRKFIRGAWPGNVLRGPYDRPGIKARTTSKLLYYISNHETDRLDHPEWALRVHSFNPDETSKMPEMRDLFRTWPGQSIVFKIHDDHLYILSNQSKVASFPDPGQALTNDEEEESFYQCYRILIDKLDIRCKGGDDGYYNPTPYYLIPVRIWRPGDHAIPTSNTLWSDLDLHLDERTGELIIIEDRQQSETATSAASTASTMGQYDFHTLIFPDFDELDEATPPKMISGIADGEVAQRFHTVGRKDILPAMSSHRHSEFNASTTRYRSYNLGASAFLNVTSDEQKASGPDATPVQRHITLRIGSRTQTSATDDDTYPLYKSSDIQKTGDRSNQNGEHFKDTDVHIWPPKTAPPALLELLNPFKDQECNLRASSDERSVMYMMGPKASEWIPPLIPSKLQIGDQVYIKANSKAARIMRRLQEAADRRANGGNVPENQEIMDEEMGLDEDDANGDDSDKDSETQSEDQNIADSNPNNDPNTPRTDHAIILINFDSGIQFPNLPEMHLNTDASADTITDLAEKLTLDEPIDLDAKGKDPVPVGSADDRKDEEAEIDGGKTPWLRIERALWMDIGKGYRFSYE